MCRFVNPVLAETHVPPASVDLKTPFPYDPAYRFTAIVEPAAPPARPELALAMQLPASVTPEFSFRLIGRAHLAGPMSGTVLPVFWMESFVARSE